MILYLDMTVTIFTKKIVLREIITLPLEEKTTVKMKMMNQVGTWIIVMNSQLKNVLRNKVF